MFIVVLAQLFSVARYQQQRVIGASTEHEDRHDRRRLTVDRHAELGQQVANGAASQLGEDHREEWNPKEDRAAVDHRQQEEDEAYRGEQQRAINALKDLDRIG